ncbi:FAD-dependent monooxygenase [Streptomyces sp. NPDC005538]|uniref:FAD-dependent monooxygenase n=1 Tax=unclassified Streptomyces TaxID=2593676 RepID=UPI0033B70360
MEDVSVIIVGSGPAGLMLAGELRLSGMIPLVLEKLDSPSGESRGIGLTVGTVEILGQRGLLSRFPGLLPSHRGHFGGVPLDLGALGGGLSAAAGIPQSVTERVLGAWVAELGVEVRRGHRFVGLVQEDDHVRVQVEGPAGPYSLRAGYLVGCDGGRSPVRKAAGFDFPGTAPTRELFLADVRGLSLEPWPTGRHFPEGMAMAGPLAEDTVRIIVAERDAPPRRRSEPPEYAEIADAWKRLTGIDITHGEPVWVSAFGDASRQVTEYRRGRVLLAGDAAHVHLPAGGQGMNTSIQDAVNLGWKLASVLRGTGEDTLLDSYHTERHPVGRQLLDNTRAQSLLLFGGEPVAPLREVLSELLQYEEVASHLAAKVSGLDIRYDTGGGTHPLLGGRLPRLTVSANGRTHTAHTLLRTAHGVLLDLEDNAHLRRRAVPWSDRVDIVTATIDPATGSALPEGTTAVLLRPDGYVAWAAPGSHTDLPGALHRWFGPPR